MACTIPQLTADAARLLAELAFSHSSTDDARSADAPAPASSTVTSLPSYDDRNYRVDVSPEVSLVVKASVIMDAPRLWAQSRLMATLAKTGIPVPKLWPLPAADDAGYGALREQNLSISNDPGSQGGLATFQLRGDRQQTIHVIVITFVRNSLTLFDALMTGSGSPRCPRALRVMSNAGEATGRMAQCFWRLARGEDHNDHNQGDLQQVLTALHRPDFPWETCNALAVRSKLLAVPEHDRSMCIHFLDRFEADVMPQMTGIRTVLGSTPFSPDELRHEENVNHSLPVSIVHSDINEFNALLSEEDLSVSALLDFGDAGVSRRVIEPAHLVCYLLLAAEAYVRKRGSNWLDRTEPLDETMIEEATDFLELAVFAPLIAFTRYCSLTPSELRVVLLCAMTRMTVSFVMGADSARQNPDNAEYILISSTPARHVLRFFFLNTNHSVVSIDAISERLTHRLSHQ